MATRLNSELDALTQIWELLRTKGYTDFEEQKVAQSTPVVNLNGVFPINDLRDETQTSGSATITDSDAEYRIHHTTAGDFARFASAIRGDYQPGKGCEAGIGIRLDTTSIDGDGVAYWGYFDMEHTSGSNAETIREGFLFGLDKDGFFIEVISGGSSQRKVYSNKFNRGKNLAGELTDGYTFQVDFPYYGYGLVKFYQVVGDTGSKQGEKRLLHTYKAVGSTSSKSPNLQIGALAKSSSTTGDFSIYVTGRQFAINGGYIPNIRNVSETNTGATYGTGSFTPMVSFQKKSGFREVGADVKGLTVDLDQDAILDVRLNGTLTGASFGTPTRNNASNTAFESDTDATDIDVSTGVQLYEDIVKGGQQNNFSQITSMNELFGSVPDEGIVTFSLQSISSSGTADATGRIQERW